MSLISKTAKVKWSSSNKSWYENKNYLFTKIGDEFEVKVEDLTKGSHSKVDYFCDYCGKIASIEWKQYLNNTKSNDKKYCNRCKSKVQLNKEMKRKSLLEKSKTFYDWCIENNHEDILDRWDYELNQYEPKNITYGTTIKCYFKCSKGIHPSELKRINWFTKHQNESMNCNMCNSFAQVNIDNLGEDFLDKYWDYDKNIGVNPWEIDIKSNKIIRIKCQEKDYHGSYEIRAYNFSNGYRCPFCRGLKVHPLDSLGKLLEDKNLLHIWSDKNKKSPYEYAINSNKPVYWKCNEDRHDDYYRDVNSSNIFNFRCPKCVRERDESFLQEKVRLYLEVLGYTILHENDCTIVPVNPKSKRTLPFDNEIKELKLIIEVHGKQHYEICSWYIDNAKKHNTTPEHELYYQQLKDRYKKIFAKLQGFFYLEIPYWTDNKEEEWKQLINDKINYILE